MAAPNEALDDIIDETSLRNNEELVDALNLLVNGTMSYLTVEPRDLRDAIEECYSESPNEVLSWIDGRPH